MKVAVHPAAHLGKFERLQLVEDLPDIFGNKSSPETRPEVLEELQRRAAWRDANPSQGKSLMEIAVKARPAGQRIPANPQKT